MMRIVRVVAVVLAMASSARAQSTPEPFRDARPEAVIQRFVDAGNARDANAMAALVAPDAIFAGFPSGRVIAQTRDGIREHYARQLQSLPADFRLHVHPRIVEGQFVIDQEHFTGLAAGPSQVTWMYLVRDGLIQRAWVLEGKPAPARNEPQ